MKAEKFEKSLTDIQDKYIEEAVQYQAHPEAPKKRSAVKVWRTIAIVAASLLAVAIAVTAIGIVSMQSEKRSMENSEAFDGPEAYDSDLKENYTADSNTEIYGGAAVPEEEPAMTETREKEAEPSNANNGSSAAQQGTKIIYTASMRISTKDFADSAAKIEAAMNKYKGFIEGMDLNNSNASYRSAYYTIRIPAEKLDAFLKEMEEVGTIDSMNRSGTDVSESYYDTETRLATAKKKLSRLQDLLSQATNLSDIIMIEDSISEVEMEIDNLTGSLKKYDSDVQYSSVTIDLDEVYSLDGSGDPELSFGDRLSQGFKTGLSTFAAVFEGLLIWLAASWLWILIIAGVVVAMIIIIVKSEKKTRKNKK